MQKVRARHVAAVVVLGLVAVELLLVAAVHVADRPSGVRLHEHYGWKMRPDVERSGAMWGGDRPAHTNGFGWRDRDRTLERADGTRIAVVGDSFTFGVGADDGERFTEWLESQAPSLEVLNLGVNGFGTDQQLRVVEEEGLAFDPDVVVCVTYLGNDLSDITHSEQHRWPKPHYRLEDGRLRLVPPEIRLWHRVRSATYTAEVLELVGRRVGLGRSSKRVPCEDPAALYLAIVDAMRDAAVERGAKLAVMLVHEPTIDAATKGKIAAGLAELGIPAVDLEPAFRAAMDAGETLFNPPPVQHWNAAGHALAGAELARGLRELGWIE
ncbi:MAG: SGNH/GDSL hydrolase family protein [Planctomycetota bacterium]